MTTNVDLNGKYPAKDHVSATLNTLLMSLSADDKAKPHAILLAGSTTPYRNDTDRELPFRQESNFFYLTGCNVPGSYFLALYQPASSQGLDYMLKTTLFIFEPTVADLLWSPAPPTLQEARDMYAVDEIGHPPKLVTTISQLPQGTIVHLLPETNQFPNIAASEVVGLKAALQSIPTKTSEYLLPALHSTRLIKDPYEIALICKANDISSRAHEVIMRVLGLAVAGKIKRPSSHVPTLPGEWLIEKEAEAEAMFVASCRREGAVHQAYLPIVAASTRASTLHYCCNDRDFAWGPVNHGDTTNTGDLSHVHTHIDGNEQKELLPQVLLIDAGWLIYFNSTSPLMPHSVTSMPVTRTIPVGNEGKFTEEAKKVYELVLRMQSESFKIVAPGTHWDDVQLLCHRMLVDGFLDMGIFKDPATTGGLNGYANGHTEVTKVAVKSRQTLVDEILLTGLSAAFFPHGLGHSMGLDVHDVPSASRPPGSGKYFVDGDDRVSGLPGGHKDFYKYLRLRLQLRAGMVVTIEPGVYFHPTLLKAYDVYASPYINTEILARYEGMGGVRIEDDVLITATGCENLTKVQSGIEWVERVCAGEDV